MASLQKQIAGLFEDADPDILELLTRVLQIEQEFLHLERPHGVMEKISDALDVIAQASLKSEGRS
jgi:hypothetical protein